MGEDVENGYVSGGNVYANSHPIFQHNGLMSLINSNNSDDIEINGDLNNVDASCGISLINSHSLSHYNEPGYFNEMDGDVENGDVSGGHCFMKIHTLSESKNLSSIYSTKKEVEILPMYPKWKILYYRMVLTLMLCFMLHSE